MELTREQSMKRSFEFAKVRQKGLSFAGRYLIISVLPSQELSESRFGIICTKKVGKAHERNLLRRRVREILRRQGDVIDSHQYMVIIMRWRAKEVDFQTLEKDWLRAYRRLVGGEGRKGSEPRPPRPGARFNKGQKPKIESTEEPSSSVVLPLN